MKKPSEKLKELSDRLAIAEKRVAEAQKERNENVEASIQRAKADAKARQESYKARAKETRTAAGAKLQELQDNYHREVQQIKNKIETEKEARDAKKANKRADDSEAYAAATIDFAIMAIDEAEIALLEAIAARAYAESLA